jgi:hypothetical protein
MSAPYIPSEEVKQLHQTHQAQAWSDMQNSSDEYDKAVLAVSSGGLGLSVVFIKDIAPHAIWLPALYISWALFGLSVLMVIISFRVGILAQRLHLTHLRKFYLEGDTTYFNRKNCFTNGAEFCNWASGISLVLAVIITIVFASVNLKEEKRMADIKDLAKATAHDSRTPVSMTPVDGIKSRTPLAMTPLPNANPTNVPASANPPAPPAPPVAPANSSTPSPAPTPNK